MRSSTNIERQRAGRRSGSVRLLVAGLFMALALAGCDDVQPVATFEPTTDPTELFIGLTLDHRAINMSTAAPYDTLQLTATPRNAKGEPMDGLPAPTFRSADTTRVWVTPDGLLQARNVATGVKVIAEVVTDNNIRRADTAHVNVTADPDPPVLTTFSITPQTPEGAVWSMIPGQALLGNIFLSPAGINILPSLPLRVLDVNGDPIPGVQIEYESLDPDLVSIHPTLGSISGTYAPGEAEIVARTTAYGVVEVDTAAFTITLPVVHGMQFNAKYDGTLVLEPSEVTIRPGGYVFWSNFTMTPVDVTFDDPTDVSNIPEVCAVWGGAMCGAGDIAAFDATNGQLNAIRGRQFTVPGIYTFESTLTGQTGRVIVAEDATHGMEEPS